MSLDQDKNRHYSLRKLSVGLTSVLIGISFASAKGQVVKADNVKDNAEFAINKQAAKPEEQDMQTSILKGTSEPAKQNAKNVDMAGKSVNISVQTSVNEENRSENSNSNLNSNNASSLNKNMQTVQNDVPKENRAEVTQPQKKQQTLSAQNSVAKLQQKNLLDNLSKQKTSIQSGNQVEDNVQTQLQNSQKLDLTKNKQLTKKVLATNLIETNSSTMVNSGFDEATWGKLDVTKWQGSVQGDYYQLTNYTGDADHVIVPNEADFEKAGISTGGKQVGVTSSLMKHIFKDKTTFILDATVAFSKTNNKMVKAIGSDWSHTWENGYGSKAKLSKFDGTNLDVSNVIDMSSIFSHNQISDLSSLANWNVAKVTNMNNMLSYNKITNLSPLANWNVSNVIDMSGMLVNNQISNVSPLANWKVDQVTDMSKMFYENQITDLSPLANWNVFNVTDMDEMFSANQISNLNPLANWKVDNVKDMSEMFLSNHISDLSPLANWKVDKVTNMSGMLVNNQISNVSPLANWKVDNVGNMFQMFDQNQISDLSPLANWNVNNVTDMSYMFRDNKISDLSPLANWDTSKVTNMHSMFENTPLKKVTLTNWDFSNVDQSFGAESIFPDTNFEVTLSDKTSKSLLDIASKLSDPVKETLKEIDSAPIVDGVHDVEGQIQDYLNSIKEGKEEYQQQLTHYKQQIDHYKKRIS